MLTEMNSKSRLAKRRASATSSGNSSTHGAHHVELVRAGGHALLGRAHFRLRAVGAEGIADDRADLHVAAAEHVGGARDVEREHAHGGEMVRPRLLAEDLDVVQRRDGIQQRVVDRLGELLDA